MDEPERQDPAPGASRPSADAATDASAAGGPPILPAEQLTAALDRHLQEGAWASVAAQPASTGGPVAEHLEELAEDMLDLLRRIKGLEVAHADLLGRVTQMDQLLRDGFFNQAKEVDALRRDLLGEQKAFIALQSFNAVVGTLDRLRAMKAGLDPKRDRLTLEQLSALIDILDQMLRSLGYVAFEPAIGDPFDPQRMVLAGHRSGKAGIVLGIERPGYAVGASIVRPAGVYLAGPA